MPICFLIKERKKGCGFGLEGRLDAGAGGETIIRMYYMKNVLVKEK